MDVKFNIPILAVKMNQNINLLISFPIVSKEPSLSMYD